MNIVVGSGPSGVAAATALLDGGQDVTMLDIGRDRDPVLVGRGEPDRDDPARKLLFGSSHPYLGDLESGLVQTGTRCLASGGLGGLSAVWGASTLPFPEDELGEWPFKAEDLRPYYAHAARLLGISGVPDALEALFPFHAPPEPPLDMSLQARRVHSRLSSQSAALSSAGIRFGRARHAVQAALCEYDAACLRGCARNAIWSSSHVIGKLKGRPGFSYRGGMRVLCLEENRQRVRLHVAPAGASRTVFEANKVFLACGPLATARLVCGSFGAPETGLPLLSQPYFVLPLLLDESVPGAPEKGLHTLAQLYLELRDPAVSKRTVHLQLYTHNEIIADRIDSAVGWLCFDRPRRRMRDILSSRLLAVQGYLHSDEGVPVAVASRGRGEDCRLFITASNARASHAAIRRAAQKLSSHRRLLGFRPLSCLMKFGLPGEGNHVGGLFPMNAAPGPWQSDRLGRLHGRGRVHLVDSSILPTLPATTFTYAVMANAWRVAAEAMRGAP